MTSSAGNCRSHAATAFGDTNGSAASLVPDVKKPNMSQISETLRFCCTLDTPRRFQMAAGICVRSGGGTDIYRPILPAAQNVVAVGYNS